MSQASAQQTVYDEPTLLFKKSLQGGVHLHPRGWGLKFGYGDIRTVDRTVYYDIEIVGMKHPKEERLPSFNENAKRYSYGKLNALYIVRPTLTYKRMITDKLRKGGIEVSWISGIGASLGFTRPVYLEIDIEPDPTLVLNTERYDPERHTANNIFGRASSLRGFDELKFWPGIHGKAGLFFEFSPYQRQLKGIETGVSVDAFFDEVPIMALEKNQQLFFNFYINLLIGEKFNREITEAKE